MLNVATQSQLAEHLLRVPLGEELHVQVALGGVPIRGGGPRRECHMGF